MAFLTESHYLLGLCLSLLGTFYVLPVTSLCYYTVWCAILTYAVLWARDRFSPWEETRGKAVLITGCDTGFGHDLARRLDQLKCTVFATCLHGDGDGAKTLRKTCSKRLHVIEMDVGSDASVAHALKYVKARIAGVGLWGIVNNAGFNVMGDVEFLGVNKYNKILNVNFYGACRVTRAFLFLVRQQKGRVAMVSSGRGKFPFPRDSAYHVSKHCLETFSDSLRLEMKKFGVQVSVVLPGNFGATTECQNHVVFDRYRQELTEMWEEATEEQRHAHGDGYLQTLMDDMANSLLSNSAPSTVPVIEAMAHALFSSAPRIRYIVSGGNNPWLDKSPNLVRVYPYLPTWLSDQIITKWTGCDTFPQKTRPISSADDSEEEQSYDKT